MDQANKELQELAAAEVAAAADFDYSEFLHSIQREFFVEPDWVE
jgi:hypothetical protein